MELHSQELSLESEGEKASFLYKEMRTQDFEIPELSSASFGMGTREAVAAFQNSHGLNSANKMLRETSRKRHAFHVHRMHKHGTYRVPRRG